MVIAAKGQSSLEETLSECRDISAGLEDPLYGCQWHLNNTGQLSISGKRITAGEDINAEGVWNEEVYGTGINVAVVSNGIDLSHEDLSAKVRSELNYNFSGKDNSDSSELSGTRAAGVTAAAGYNGLGTRGVAPGASIYSNKLTGDLRESDAMEAGEAMVRNKEITAVSVSDRGSEDGVFLQGASAEWEEGVEEGIREGFYGRGIFYVLGAGDGHESGDQANFSEYSNYYGVTAVCSTDGSGKKSLFSEEGVNLWVCAPGPDIATTDSDDDHAVTSGTVLSVSRVAGVAALLREVNEDLSWRDIKLILAGSARQNDVPDISWETGAVKYGSDVERYRYSSKYGFGVVDAEAAAELAGSWKGVGEMRTVTASSDNELTIPDGEGEADGVLTSRLMISDLEEIFTEFVEVELVLSCDCLQDLNIRITSPSGTVSELVRESASEFVRGSSNEENDCVSYLGKKHRFGSARHLGEDPSGEWTLKIYNTASGDEEDTENTVTLHSWSIRVYGHGKEDTLTDFGGEITAKALTLGNVPGGRLTWTQHKLVNARLFEAAGGRPPYTYSLAPLPPGLNFNGTTRIINGRPTAAGDTDVQYTARDANNDTARSDFVIRITANAAPVFGSKTVAAQVYTARKAIEPLELPEATGGDGTLTYNISGNVRGIGLNFNRNTRILSGMPTSVTPGITAVYTATDADGDTAELRFNIRVRHQNDIPTFGSQMVDDQNWVNGSAVRLTLPRARNGNGTLTYGITPALPDGLDFDPGTRVLSGTPTAAAPENTYTYTVTDSDNDIHESDSDSLTFRIRIKAATEVPSFGSQTVGNKIYTAGVQISPFTLPLATQGTGITLRLTPRLPSGLNFNHATGEISGIPTTATSETDYTWRATDRDGYTAEITFSITIRAADTEPTFGGETTDDQEYVAGSQITPVTLPVATGGNAPLAYGITPDLPAGLDFDENARVLSGTPTTATSKNTYTYTVTDEDGDTDEIEFGITVSEDTMPTFDGETIEDKVTVNGVTEVMETLPLATGGNGTLTYSLTDAGSNALNLFAGLDWDDNTRVLSGTPNIGSALLHLLPRTETYTWTVTDEDGDTAEITFSIVIEEDSMPEFSVTTIEDQVYRGRSIMLPVATGGNAPLVYSITPPLPPVLRLNENTGVISGTSVRASSAATYRYTVTDRDGDMKELTFRFSAAAPPPTSSNSGGGGGCAVSDQSIAIFDILGVMACLILIPVSVIIRRKRRSQIKT